MLARDKFRRWLTPDEVDQFVADITALADTVDDPPERATADPKDEFLVALAQAADVVALISGDPHLADLEHLKPPVSTPGAFLDWLDKQQILRPR